MPLSLFPSGEGGEGSGLGQAATLSCPIPASANQNGFDVCLKMKPRYASVFMMLAIFLQSSKKEEKMFRWAPILPLHAHRYSYVGGGGKRGQIQEPQTKPGGPISWWQHLQIQVGLGDAGPAGSLVSMLLSPIIHAGNWPVCPTLAPVVIYGRRRSKKKAE